MIVVPAQMSHRRRRLAYHCFGRSACSVAVALLRFGNLLQPRLESRDAGLASLGIDIFQLASSCRNDTAGFLIDQAAREQHAEQAAEQ